MQQEERVKARDVELKEQEALVKLQLKGQPLFEDLKVIDEVGANNKYFKE